MGYIDYNILIYIYVYMYIYVYIYVNIIYIYIILYYIIYTHNIGEICPSPPGAMWWSSTVSSTPAFAPVTCRGPVRCRRNGGRVGSDLNFWCHVVNLGRNTEDRPKKGLRYANFDIFWWFQIKDLRINPRFSRVSRSNPPFFSSAGAAGDDSHQCSSRSDHVWNPAGCEGPTDKAAAMSVGISSK